MYNGSKGRRLVTVCSKLNPERDYVTTCEDAAKHLKIVNEALDLLANYRDGRYNTATRYRSSRRRNTTTRH